VRLPVGKFGAGLRLCPTLIYQNRLARRRILLTQWAGQVRVEIVLWVFDK
jgi:hypothetical protein